MKVGRGAAGLTEARTLIGRRITWHDHADDDLRYGGTIIHVVLTANHYVRWIVEWDEGTPTWWSSRVSPGASGVRVEP